MLRTRPPRRRIAFATAAATALFAACSDSTTSPSTSASAIAGTYAATTFVVTAAGQPSVDVLAQGGTMSLTISSSGATTGTITVPAALAGGTAFTESLAGTAVQTGNSVHFTQTQTSVPFVSSVTFTVSGNTLQTNQTVNALNYNVVLTRQ